MAQEKIKGQWLQKISESDEALLYPETSADQVIYSIENEGLSNETIVTVKDKLDNILGDGGTVSTAQVANNVKVVTGTPYSTYHIPAITNTNTSNPQTLNYIWDLKVTSDESNKATVTATKFVGSLEGNAATATTATTATTANELRQLNVDTQGTPIYLTGSSTSSGSEDNSITSNAKVTNSLLYVPSTRSLYITGDEDHPGRIYATASKAVADEDGKSFKEWYPRLSAGTDGKPTTIPAAYLPSFVDDVVEGTYRDGKFYTSGNNLITPEASKIYVDTATNITYRYSGTKYVEISSSLALGETTSTAFAGDRGKALEEGLSALEDEVDKLPTADTWRPIYVNSSKIDGGTAPAGVARMNIVDGDYVSITTEQVPGMVPNIKINSAKWVEVGETVNGGPSEDLVIGGLFFKRTA